MISSQIIIGLSKKKLIEIFFIFCITIVISYSDNLSNSLKKINLKTGYFGLNNTF